MKRTTESIRNEPFMPVQIKKSTFARLTAARILTKKRNWELVEEALEILYSFYNMDNYGEKLNNLIDQTTK